MNVPETFFSVSEELVLFGLSCLCGVAVGVFYDIFRTLRIIIPHSTILTATEDIIFLSAYAVFLSAFASAESRGELRFYYVVGNFIGFIVYFFTVGNFITGLMRKIFSLSKRIFSFTLKPFKLLYVFFREKVKGKFVGNSENVVKRLKNSKILLLKRNELLYNEIENNKKRKVKSGGKSKKTKKTGVGTF